MKYIQDHLREVDKAMAAEDGDADSGPELPPWVSSLVFWVTTVGVAALVLWSFVR